MNLKSAAEETSRTVVPFRARATDKQARTFEGYASTFGGPPDSHGDIVRKGAYARTLNLWRQTQSWAPLPLLDMHSHVSVRMIVGKLIDAREDDHGLWTKWELVDSPDGVEILARLRMGALTGLSIGYAVLQSAQVKLADGSSARELLEIRLFEVSLVTFPSNYTARVALETVKSATASDPLPQERRRDLERRISALSAGYEAREQQKRADLTRRIEGLRSWQAARDEEIRRAERLREIRMLGLSSRISGLLQRVG